MATIEADSAVMECAQCSIPNLIKSVSVSSSQTEQPGD